MILPSRSEAETVIYNYTHTLLGSFPSNTTKEFVSFFNFSQSNTDVVCVAVVNESISSPSLEFVHGPDRIIEQASGYSDFSWSVEGIERFAKLASTPLLYEGDPYSLFYSKEPSVKTNTPIAYLFFNSPLIRVANETKQEDDESFFTSNDFTTTPYKFILPLAVKYRHKLTFVIVNETTHKYLCHYSGASCNSFPAFAIDVTSNLTDEAAVAEEIRKLARAHKINADIPIRTRIVPTAHYPLRGSDLLTSASVSDWIDAVLSRKATPFYRSQPIPPASVNSSTDASSNSTLTLPPVDDETGVSILTSNSLHTLLTDPRSDDVSLFVRFTAAPCHSCRQLRAFFHRVGKEIQAVLKAGPAGKLERFVIGELDADLNDIPAGVTITALPTVLFFPAHNHTHPIECPPMHSNEQMKLFLRKELLHEKPTSDNSTEAAAAQLIARLEAVVDVSQTDFPAELPTTAEFPLPIRARVIAMEKAIGWADNQNMASLRYPPERGPFQHPFYLPHTYPFPFRGNTSKMHINELMNDNAIDFANDNKPRPIKLTPKKQPSKEEPHKHSTIRKLLNHIKEDVKKMNETKPHPQIKQHEQPVKSNTNESSTSPKKATDKHVEL